jgi:hypothetical protein
MSGAKIIGKPDLSGRRLPSPSPRIASCTIRSPGPQQGFERLEDGMIRRMTLRQRLRHFADFCNRSSNLVAAL